MQMSSTQSMYKLENYMNYERNIRSHHGQILQSTYHTPVLGGICKLFSIYQSQRGSRKGRDMNKLCCMHMKFT